ncbi:SAM-dependent methyltransferase [Salipiger sp. P9]|uniref:class I SAM-dependent methyltransferase n=1 Tax=Salipiger pentaromativorans TaxID=2943193 RepID=UPI0021570C85|nr:SAM-dependent methyltransferase [Salipiger pentaromativorans]MCR8550921.1 SAM-dependent methyltransferase [Salipiger pentaromativorans]
MTPLKEILTRRIAVEGPMSLAEYMGLCLMHPQYGYYPTRDPLGAAGDFTTAPEISQMFGELLGLCLAQCWLDQGRPSRFVLAELGPGRGTLMADALRAMRAVPGLVEAAELHLVETSPRLRAEQAARLSGAAPVWQDSVAALPEAPLFLIANEFFDALPIRQFVRAGQGWAERVVGLRDGVLSFGLTEPAAQAALAHRLADTQEGDLVETCAPGQGIAAEIGRRIAARGGAALIVDYGDWHSLGDTLQALRAHERAAPLETPGEADLTAHVDFEALALAAPCAHTKLTPQGVFLERLGITDRARALARGLSGAALDSHVAAHRRLTHPGEMGSVFKTLGFFPEGAPPPPGLLT